MNKLKKRVSKRRKRKKIFKIVMSCITILLLAVGYIVMNKSHADKVNKERKNKVLYVEQNSKKNKQEVKDKDKKDSTSTVEGSKKEDEPLTSKPTQEIVQAEEQVQAQDQVDEDISDDTNEIENRIKVWNFLADDNVKRAYLTFDDGPSEKVTEQILDILKRNNVKATFFVLGSSIEANEHRKDVLRRIANEGHAIANHGYCHNYSKLYPNKVADGNFVINDFNTTQQIINQTLGYELPTKVIRLPGGHGSWYTQDLDWRLSEEGYSYLDWNVLNGDAEHNGLSAAQLVDEFKKNMLALNGNDDIVVILMHDTDMKQTTADSLEDNIKYLKALGYQFRKVK